MKRITLILTLCILSFFGVSQTGYQNTTTTGSASTLFKSKGYLATDSAFLLLQSFRILPQLIFQVHHYIAVLLSELGYKYGTGH